MKRLLQEIEIWWIQLRAFKLDSLKQALHYHHDSLETLKQYEDA